MRLIDADALWCKLDGVPWYDNADRDEIALSLVDDAPTVDAVEVVRCMECKHWESHCNGKAGSCQKRKGVARANDFCSYGERSGDNAAD